jgi:hypothetical protein
MMTAKPTMLITEALRLAKHGLAVFPCQPRGKAPLGTLAPHGVHDASRDPEIIRAWWRAEPLANLGLATGAISGLFVLDVDRDHGGEDSLASLARHHGELPPTVVSLTGGGGRHLLFRHPGFKVRNLVGFNDGLDIRGDGGFIVAPPSVHPSGGRYRWAPHSPHRPAEAPSWLLDVVREPDRVLEVPEGRPVVTPSRYAAAAVRRACGAIAGAAPGTRNSTLNSEAFGIGQLVGAGALTEEYAIDALAWAAHTCGLGHEEILRTLESGLHAGMAQPRAMGDALCDTRTQ